MLTQLGRAIGASVMSGAVALWLTAAGQASQTPASPTAAGGQGPPAARELVGPETCLTCHEDKALTGTAHGRRADPRTPMAKEGCESCHGPGQAHVDAGGDRTKIVRLTALAPREASERCLACHNRSQHALFESSAHNSRNVSCVTCHSVHAPKSERAQLKTVTQVETCAQCHRQQAMKIRRTAHMPLREGKLECSSCHNPHGSDNVKLLRVGTSVNESCTSCHAEKRGPFLWEHAPVRENCTTCHDPHGSSNDRMLVAKAPMLCQRCHAHTRHPSTIYDLTNVTVAKSNRIFGRSCVNCHSNVHGSNHPSGKTFLR